MCGYASHQDPRLRAPDAPEPERRCGDCAHYAECERSRGGEREVIGLCCVERDSGSGGEVYHADADDTPEGVGCDWWVA